MNTSANPTSGTANRYFRENFRDNYVVQVYLDDWSNLSAQDQLLAYHLNEFTLATRDLTFKQSHPKGLELRNFLENLYVGYKHLCGKPGYVAATEKELEAFLKTYYLWHGPYVWGGQNKIVVDLPDADLRAAVQLVENHAGAVTVAEYEEFAKLLTDPGHEPYIKGPNGELGTQVLYVGLTLDEIRKFRDAKYPSKYIPTNSRLTKQPDGTIVEEFARTGGRNLPLPPPMPGQKQFDIYQSQISHLDTVLQDTNLSEKQRVRFETTKTETEIKRDKLYFNWVDGILEAYVNGKESTIKGDVPPGLYAGDLNAGMPHLDAAIATLPMGYDKAALEFTKRALQSAGDNPVYNYVAAHAANKATGAVRMAAGFGDNYADPLAQTGFWNAWVFQTLQSDLVKKVTEPQQILKLQESIPWQRQFDNPNPVANTTLIDWMLSVGGLCPACPGGFNTADDHLGRFAPSLSTIVVNWTTARAQGSAPGTAGEFYLNQTDRDRIAKRMPEMGKLAIVLHESLGHAIGNRKANYAEEITPHGQMLEEARAEGAAAYFMGDPDVMRIAGLDEEDLKAYYLDFVTDALLISLNRIPEGDTQYRRPHERAFNLISHYLLDGKYGVRAINEKGEPWTEGQSVYFEVADVKAVRTGLGKLLGELMWIIGKGDKTKAAALDAQYGVVVNDQWIAQAKARGKKVDFKPQWVALLPELRAERAADGSVESVKVWTDTSFLNQQLRFSGKLNPKGCAESLAK